jgi:tetratricopeptide (TPR) repeat protein
MFCNLCGTNLIDGSLQCSKCKNFFPINLEERNYKIILASFSDYSAKKETAKYLASRSKDIDLKTALSRLEKLPLVLSNRISKSKAVEFEKNFTKLGARIKFVPIIENPTDKQKLIEELKRPIKRSYLEEKKLEIPKSVERLETEIQSSNPKLKLFIIPMVLLLLVLALVLMYINIQNFSKRNKPEGPGISPTSPTETSPEPATPLTPETVPEKDNTKTIPDKGDGKTALPVNPEILKKPPKKLNPDLVADRTSTLNTEAIELFTKGSYKEALEKFLTALASDPKDATLKSNVAACYSVLGWQELEKGDTEKAETHFINSLLYSDSDSLTYKGLGRAYELQGELDSAEQYYRTAIELNPNDDDLIMYLGLVLYQNNKLGEALEYLKEYSDRYPDDVNAKNLIAKIELEYSVEETYDIKEGSHFIVKYEGGSREVVGRFLLTTLEQVYETVGVNLGRYPTKKITVVLYSNKEFKDATRSPDWAGALFDGKIRIPIKGLSGRTNELTRMVTHEYTHAVIFDIAGLNCPVWLHEGMAQYMEKADVAKADELILEYYKRYEDIPSLKDFSGGFMGLGDNEAYFAYMLSLSGTNYLIKTYGMSFIRDLLTGLGEGREFDEVFTDVYFITFDSFMSRWKNKLKNKL